MRDRLQWLLVLAVLIAEGPARAQTAPPPPWASPAEHADAEAARLYGRGRTLRAVGIPLTVVGTIGVAGGLALVLMGEKGACVTPIYRGIHDGLDACDDGSALRGVGLITLLASLPMALAGGTLWALGDARIDRANRLAYRPLTVRPVLAPVAGGAVAGLEVTAF
jgi:hypothetical protein